MLEGRFVARDRPLLVGTAIGLLGLLLGSILSTTFRTFVFVILGLALATGVLVGVGVLVLWFFFSRAVRGPKTLAGTRCPSCGKRRAMQEASREFLRGNVKFPFDHYKVVYRCVECGHEHEQEEHVPIDDESTSRMEATS